MSCTNAIAANILNSCDTIPRAGLEKDAWVIRHSSVRFTFGTLPLITGITTLNGAQFYTIRAYKKDKGVDFTLKREDSGDLFTHGFDIRPHEHDAVSIKHIDQLEGVVVIVELKGEKTEGCFLAFGVDVGLWKSGSNQRVNNQRGIPVYDFKTPGYLGERYSRYVVWNTDYETTKNMILKLTAGVTADQTTWSADSTVITADMI